MKYNKPIIEILIFDEVEAESLLSNCSPSNNQEANYFLGQKMDTSGSLTGADVRKMQIDIKVRQ